MRGRLLPLSLLGAMLLALSPLAAQEEYNDDIRSLLHEGVSLYKRGQHAEAYSKFEEAFQKKPSSDLVYAFIKRVGDDVITGMMSASDENIKGVGYRLFELAKPGEVIRKGKKEILKYLEDLRAQDHAVQRNAHWHLKNFGPWALRFVVPVLGDDQQDEFRSRVILLLTEMGQDATLAVVEALDSDNAFMRQNAAIVLGNIKDERAIPALKRVYEDPNEPPEVKKYAHEAIQKITRKGAAEWKKAADYYFELAEKYYYSHPSAILAWNRAHLIFRWDPDRKVLTEREVPRFAFNEQLAEEAIYDLLALDPNSVHGATRASALSLLACIHFQQALEAEAGLFAAEQAMKAGEPGLLPDHLETLKTLLQDAERNNVLAKVPGRAHLYQALARCLKDGNGLVGASIIDTLKRMGRADDLPGVSGDGQSGEGSAGYPLIEALTSEDKRVRYAAAEALSRINPQKRKLGMELVIPNLVDALGEQGVRVALLIYDVQDDGDRNYVNSMKKLLASINVFPIVATNGADGIIKAKQFPTEDVIIIQRKVASQIYFRETEVSKPVVETVFDTLRDDVRTKNIPRILLCDGKTAGASVEKELEETKSQYAQTAQGYIAASIHKLDLQAALDGIFDSPEAQKDAKDRADAIARRAAEALAEIDPSNTLLPFRDAVDGLIKTLNPEVLRDDAIRVPAARALGRFGDQRALDVLSKVLGDRADGDDAKLAQQKPVRLACAAAISDILRQTQIQPPAELFEILKKSLVDGDYDIERECAEALGNAQLSNAQRVELEQHRRVNVRRPSRTAEDE